MKKLLILLTCLLAAPFFTARAQPVTSPSLLASALLGGNSWETARAVALGADGQLILAGETASSDFPLLGSSARTSPQDVDVFLAVYDAPGRLSQSRLLGGNSTDSLAGLVVENGIAYLAGTTTSSDFPAGTTPKGAEDIFLLAVDLVQDQIIYAVRLGGADQDLAQALAVESGQVYLTGMTRSADFPAPGYHANGDAFVVKLAPSGAVAYAVLIGGRAEDAGLAIAVRGGEATLTGQTWSSDLAQAGLKGADDVFVARLDSDGQVSMLTLLGGKGEDSAQAIALDPAGRIYLAGLTRSSDFPAGSGSFSGESDAFLAWLAPDGALIGARYLGGSRLDEARSLALDAAGNIYLAGETASADFPLTGGALQSQLNGPNDAFFAWTGADRLAEPGWTYSSYLGGAASETAQALALGDDSLVVLVGETASNDFPVPPGGSPAEVSGPQDAFVVWLGVTSSVLEITPLPTSAPTATPPNPVGGEQPLTQPTESPEPLKRTAPVETSTTGPAIAAPQTTLQPVARTAVFPTTSPPTPTPSAAYYNAAIGTALQSVTPTDAQTAPAAPVSEPAAPAQPARSTLPALALAGLVVLVVLVAGWFWWNKRPPS